MLKKETYKAFKTAFPHITKQFINDFITWHTAALDDQRYTDEEAHEIFLALVAASKFYNKYSCEYCEFLEMFHQLKINGGLEKC